jgi:hypothetical protein
MELNEINDGIASFQVKLNAFEKKEICAEKLELVKNDPVMFIKLEDSNHIHIFIFSALNMVTKLMTTKMKKSVIYALVITFLTTLKVVFTNVSLHCKS